MDVGVCLNLSWYPLATQERCWLSLEVMIGTVTIVIECDIEY